MPKLQNPADHMRQVANRLVAGMLLAAVVLLPLGSCGWLFSLILTGAALLIGGLIYGWLWYERPRYARQLAALERGEHLARWSYDQETWQRFLTAEQKASALTASEVGLLFGILWGLMVLVCVPGYFLSTISPADAAVGLAVMSAIGVWCLGFSMAGRLLHLRRLKRETGEAVIGHDGIYFADEYRAWATGGQRLCGVAISERDLLLLEFTFRIHTGRGSYQHVVRVPVPPGQEVAASKAARVVTAAGGRAVVDFGSRRAHGTDAALKVARTSYLAGAAGTSNVLAGKMYGLPIFGTMAHSYIQAHDDELQTFETFARLYPRTTLLVDTYDTLAGVRNVIELGRRLGEQFQVRAIRLDSGDIVALAKESRRLLDEAGLTGVTIFASSELDEYKIADYLRSDAPIDGFGVGTRLAVSADAPDIDMAYKLVEYDARPRVKLSSHKVLYPGRKQVFRTIENGRMTRDILARHDESLDGEPLLQPVMRNGQRLPAGRVSLEDARRHAEFELTRLPDAIRRLEPADPPYPVEVSDTLQQDLETLRREHGG